MSEVICKKAKIIYDLNYRLKFCTTVHRCVTSGTGFYYYILSFNIHIFEEDQYLNTICTQELTVILSKLLNLTKFTFSFCKMCIIYKPAHRVVVIRLINLSQKTFVKIVCFCDDSIYNDA